MPTSPSLRYINTRVENRYKMQTERNPFDDYWQVYGVYPVVQNVATQVTIEGLKSDGLYNFEYYCISQANKESYKLPQNNIQVGNNQGVDF